MSKVLIEDMNIDGDDQRTYYLTLKRISVILGYIARYKEPVEFTFDNDNDNKCFLKAVYDSKNINTYFYIYLSFYSSKWYREDTTYKFYISQKKAAELYILSCMNLDLLKEHIKWMK